MLGKYILPLKTKSKAKKSTSGRITTGFEDSLNIGILYTYSNPDNFELVSDLMRELKSAGKRVKTLTYIAQLGKDQNYPFPFFNEKDLDVWGNWTKEIVTEFIQTPFDYLLSLDLNTNKMTQNILANSKAQCRIGKYEEGTSLLFELMIDHKENDYGYFVDQVYHYLKNVRNGE